MTDQPSLLGDLPGLPEAIASAMNADDSALRAMVKPAVELRIYGMPAPQGSKRPVSRGQGEGRRIIMVEESKRVAPWRQDVSAAAQAYIEAWCFARPQDGARGDVVHRRWIPLDGPLVAVMVFTMPKPKGAPKRRRTWPASAPDLSKLVRSTEDALTTAGVWADDSRVVEYARLAKVFPGEDPDALRSPGALVRVWTMAAWREAT